MIIEVFTGFFWNVFFMLIAPYLLWLLWDRAIKPLIGRRAK